MYDFPLVAFDSPIVAHEVLTWTEMWERNLFWALANQETLQKLLLTGRIPAHLIQDAQRAVSWSFFSRQWASTMVALPSWISAKNSTD